MRPTSKASAVVSERRVRTRVMPPSAGFSIDARAVWRHRELLYFFIWRDVKVRYKQTLIGAAWVILQPLLTMVVFTLIFGKLAKLPAAGLPQPIFYFSGLLPWVYFSNTLGNGTQSLTSNYALVTKVYFPRVLLPLASVAAGLVDLGIAFFILMIMLASYGIFPSDEIVLLPLFFVLVLITAIGTVLWLSALNAIYRDVRYVVPFAIQLWLFASPVVYPLSLVPQHWRWAYGLNPMAGAIEGFRWSLTGHGTPPSIALLASCAISIAILVSGIYFFGRTETYVADVV